MTSASNNSLPQNNQSAIAAQPSYVVLPRDSELNGNRFEFVADFLKWKFNQISAEVWAERITQGKVHWQDGNLISATTPYVATKRVYYYREVEFETKVPFKERILFKNDHSIVVFKPHFLPVTPGGNYVNECLIHRVRKTTGIDTVAPAHRLDKDTAGIILLTTKPETRHQYHQLFLDGNIDKRYQAVAKLTKQILSEYQQGELALPQHWTVKNRLKRGEPSFTMRVAEGEANTHSEISLVEIKGEYGLFELSPITGKMHQLRVHMQSLGMPLLDDKFYPELQPKSLDFVNPMQLLAKKLSYIDPVTNQALSFEVEGLSLP
ncbi:pseudouridine synthase [Shewanella maritima]|uniref:Pseudouridine synthase n=1 Tax=Shewanella maritima TaxID=2520507 RepID=A0A411PGV2_9GAMM|nr:pseudouridine synthase [Shewanella maritima]QBF82612.1 pseudouridine synthase [Shewanella maritima]